jgi:drug/metabolite transporter (DMT)-like permease
MGQERLTPRSICGTALGFAGVALAMAPGAALPDSSLIGWALVAALCPACYAASNLIGVQWAPRNTQPLAAATGTLVAAAVFMAVLGLALGQFHIPGEAAPLGEALLPVQSVMTGVAYLVYFGLLVRAGSVVTSQSGYIVTIMGVFWGAIIFGERLGPLTFPAAALVFCGLWLVTHRRDSRGADLVIPIGDWPRAGARWHVGPWTRTSPPTAPRPRPASAMSTSRWPTSPARWPSGTACSGWT